MGKNGLSTIEDIHNLYDVTVWDNCPLTGHLTGGKNGRVNDALKFAKFFIDKIPLYNCFVPELVFDEYVFEGDNRWKLSKKRINLIKKFQSEDRVLYVDDFPLGPKVKKRTKKLQEDNGINKTDWSVYAWAVELSDYFGSATIISNDIRGLARLWRAYVHKKIITPRKLGFVIRKELDLYERFYW